MLQLTVLGQGSSTVTPVGRYPFRIGRGAGDQLRIEAPGVWERHCTLHWDVSDGIRLVGSTEAITMVNGQQVKETRIHNGDLLEIGAARVLLTVCPAVQRNFRWMEALVWFGLAVVGLSQVYLMLLGLP